MYYPKDESARMIWGLEDRAYTQTEVDASDHLKWAIASGALVREETIRFDTIVKPEE